METPDLRIIDANLNRAREALRVIEDHARFALDDHDAAAAAKNARHALRTIADTLGSDALLAARDILADVGRETKAPAELERSSGEDVVRAAFARLSEAARSIGEYAKLTSSDAASAAEQLRYRAYELEQRAVLRGRLRARFRDVRLYVLITQAVCRGDWLTTAETVLRAGATCLQLREKALPDAELLRRARQLRKLTRAHGALLIINDRPDIARLCGADGVHVGQGDLSVGQVRSIAGGQVLVGRSTHTLTQLEAALREEPDHVAVGPMFPSATKPQDHIAGPQTFRQAAERTALPLVAIGGITPDNAAAVIEAGASCLCVCAAVIGAADPGAAVEALLARINAATVRSREQGAGNREQGSRDRA